ncbi:MAG: BamA/TamA family outer membrane protein [Bacteroidota bacterium]|nr:BamA/TamA family outer membrane protein [Bacteroidota bacterium]
MLGLLLLFFNSCKSTKLVPQDQHLLVKNKIKTIDNSNNILNKVISSLDNNQSLYIKHKPNRRILVLGQFYLKLYNFGSSKKNPNKNESKSWRRYFRKIGESPVILDSNEVNKSELNIQKYLVNKGFLNAEVTSQIKYRRKKAIVTYTINPQTPFLIKQVNFFADDSEIDQILNSKINQSFLVIGQNLDIDIISKERNRIHNMMRNIGYYEFSKEVIDFELDTFKQNNHVVINVYVSNKIDGTRFIKKRINQVYVTFENDTNTHFTSKPMLYKDIIFSLNGYPIKPFVIANLISIKKDSLFNQFELENTYTRLSELPIFKFIEITFKRNENDSQNTLNAFITLRTNLRQTLSIEPQGIVSQLNRIQNTNFGSTSYGIANSLIWSHRNIFHNAELLEVSTNTRIESQLFKDPSNPSQLVYTNLAVQQSLNLSLIIPKSSLLKPIEKWRSIKSIKTIFNLSYLYEYNPDFVRKILPLTYQYQINTKRFNWFLSIAEMSFSRNNLNVDLNGRQDSAFIRRIFQNNLITSSGLSVIYTDKNKTPSRTFFFVRANLLELGGNLHRISRRFIDGEKRQDTSYQILKVNYFQYAKSEIDVRCSTKINDRSSTAFRFNIGAIYPYGNTKEVAFDKLFFIGGANSLRGWRPRTIGPGSYSSTSNNFRIDRAGDLIMQSSIEYRFDLIQSRLEGAFFADAGNVFIMRNINGVDPTKLFNASSFYRDIGANGGIGLRIDFQFFLFRLDYGFQIHNPELDNNEKWVIRKFAKDQYFSKYGMLNFGIGYPF